MICSQSEQKYQIEFGTDDYFKCDNCSTKMSKELKDLVDFNNLSRSINSIETYFENNNGTCK